VNDDLFTERHSMTQFRRERWLVPLLIAALCVALSLGGDAAREWGRYDRAALETGQLWRLLTGHLVHLGWGHLWPNILALLLISGLVEEFLKPTEFAVASVAAALGIDAGLYAFDPGVPWYVGLSGVLHGLVACGALMMLQARQFRIGAALGLGLAAKLAFEQIHGPIPFTQASAGGPVIVAAHLYGTISGALAAVAFGFLRRPAARL
jgi:rhomboid family GlyGly-CTERM serine protease